MPQEMEMEMQKEIVTVSEPSNKMDGVEQVTAPTVTEDSLEKVNNSVSFNFMTPTK